MEGGGLKLFLDFGTNSGRDIGHGGRKGGNRGMIDG